MPTKSGNRRMRRPLSGWNSRCSKSFRFRSRSTVCSDASMALAQLRPVAHAVAGGKEGVVGLRLRQQKHDVVVVPALAAVEHGGDLHGAEHRVGRHGEREEEPAALEGSHRARVGNPLVLRFDLEQETFVAVSRESQLVQQAREVDGATKRRQPGALPVPSLGPEPVSRQEAEHAVRHAAELRLVETLAVEIQVLGEPVDALEQPQARAADEGQLADVPRRGEMVQDDQLYVLFQKVLLEDRPALHGFGVEAPDGVHGDHSSYTFRSSRTRCSSARERKRAANAASVSRLTSA